MLGGVKEQVQRGAQFFSVLYDTVVTNHGELARPETMTQRIEICKSCERFNPAKNRCGLCGCGIRDPEVRGFLTNLANKIAHRSSFCPLKKWGAEVDVAQEVTSK